MDINNPWWAMSLTPTTHFRKEPGRVSTLESITDIFFCCKFTSSSQRMLYCSRSVPRIVAVLSGKTTESAQRLVAPVHKDKSGHVVLHLILEMEQDVTKKYRTLLATLKR